MTKTADVTALRASRTHCVQALYDTWSPVFVQCAGTTHQTVLLPVGVTPQATNLEMVRRAGFGGAQRLLDAGCGVCGPACDAANAVPGLRVDAVTLSPVQAELAKQVIERQRLTDRVCVHVADYHQLPFADQTFDALWLLESACYSPRPAQLLGELARVAAVGATLYIKDLFLAGGDFGPQAVRDLQRLRHLWALPRLWPLARWIRWVERAGWQVCDASVLQGANTDWYTGAMIEFGANGLQWNDFGRQFAVHTPAAPIEWCQLVARRSGPARRAGR